MSILYGVFLQIPLTLVSSLVLMKAIGQLDFHFNNMCPKSLIKISLFGFFLCFLLFLSCKHDAGKLETSPIIVVDSCSGKNIVVDTAAVLQNVYDSVANSFWVRLDSSFISGQGKKPFWGTMDSGKSWKLLPYSFKVDTGKYKVLVRDSDACFSPTYLLNIGCDTTNVGYAKDIKPIITQFCVKCHGDERNTLGGKIRLDSYNELKAYLSDDTDTLFIKSITQVDSTVARYMPKNAMKLSNSNINKLQAWINQNFKK